MGVLRGVVIFLVGLGVAIGAHFAGLFDRVPHFWRHDEAIALGPAPVDPSGPPVIGSAADVVPETPYEAGPSPDGYPPEGPPEGYSPEGYPPEGDRPQGDRPQGRPPVTLRLSYAPPQTGERGGCVPIYELRNYTRRALQLSLGGAGSGAGLRIEPGSSLRPVEDAGSQPRCDAGIVRILLAE